MDKDVVEVKRHEGAGSSFELDVAHGSGFGGAAGDEHGVEHGAHGAEGVAAGFFCVAGDVDLHAARLGDACGEFEVGVVFADGCFEVLLEVAIPHSGDCDGADFGEVDGAAAAYGYVDVDINHPPPSYLEGVAGADDVVGVDLYVAERGVGCGDVVEYFASEYGQGCACGSFDIALKCGLGRRSCVG